MKLSFACQRDIVVLRLSIVELGHGNDLNARAIFYDNSLKVLCRRTGTLGKFCSRRKFPTQTPLGAIESGFETLSVKRLQKVIDRMHIEGADGIFIVGSNEYDGPIRANQLEHFEAVQLRHLNIEEEKIGFEFANHLHRIESVGALRNDFNFTVRRKELSNHLTREFFVVDNHSANLLVCAHTHAPTPFGCAGKRKLTRKELPSV